MKKILSIIIAIAIFATIGTLVAFAERIEIGYLNNGADKVEGISSISDSGNYGSGTGTTIITWMVQPTEYNFSCSVSVQYQYADFSEGKIVTLTNSSGGSTQAITGCARPQGSNTYYKSLRTTSTHTANANGQTWNATTSIDY